jgi:hypothetical protein
MTQHLLREIARIMTHAVRHCEALAQLAALRT